MKVEVHLLRYGGVVSNSDFKMKKLLLLTLFSLLPLGTVNAAFFISGKEMCGYGDYSYQIGPNVMFADLSVQAGPNVMFADITIQIVESPQEADLVFVDNSLLNYQSLNAVDMTICKTSMFADKSIQIGPNVMFADISVQVGKNVMFPDYKLYFRSDNYSVNEAAGIFPAIWKFNEN